MTCYKFEYSHWWKIHLKKNPLQDLLSSLNAVISTNESTEFISGHVIYNPAYTYKFQLKTTLIQKIDPNHRSELKYQTTCGAEFLPVFLHNFDKNFLQTFFLSGHVRQLSF